ncbi:TauD/TfdA dioxygenase family protein [Marinomonas algicola]|uniref:TauD/TfdA dioxygenase family protein n=1 Tax=Marinomonas algicola TaxID=2773454 RepID=UPI00174CF952|nr:TauD/TfdA family dioxygenase [Marinomonas algicola]
MKIQPLSQHIGALIEGIQLAELDEPAFNELQQAFLKHQVLFFREQTMSPQEHLKLGQRFGQIEAVHPFFPHLDDADQVVIIETSRGNPPGESFWHTDLTWQEKPSKCSILHAQYVPQTGGDTVWCSMQAVWDRVPAEQKNYLRTLQGHHALHAFEGSRYDRHETDQPGKQQSFVANKSKEYPPVIHPVVTRHPETGRETLFVNEQFTRSIVGMEDAESQALLNELFALARSPEFQVRFQWQAGSVALWDNRNTQHYAVTDYGDQPRRLHRVTVCADG